MGHGSPPKCGGTNRQGDPCKNAAGYKTDHPGAGNCTFHGGSTRTGRVSALNQQAERLLHRMDAPPCSDPLEALQRLAGRALALEEVIGKLVNDLTEIRYESGGDSEFGKGGGGEQLRAEVGVLERAMDRCGRLLVDIAKLNIDERMARVTERQAEMMQTALTDVLGEMGFEPAQQADARKRIARHLRVVASA